MVEQIIERVEQKIGEGEVKATLGDYIRLVQLQKELEEESRGRSRSGGWTRRRTRKRRRGRRKQTARHKVSPAAVAAEISRFAGAI